MQGWWEGLSPWDQASYFVSGLGAVYLLRFIPWHWLAKIPPGPGRGAGSETSDGGWFDIDIGSSDDGGSWPDAGGDQGGGDASHGGSP